MFCGSKKSLASGLPMASVLFASGSVGLIVLPLMLFHQLQLMVCATLARRYAAEGAVTTAERSGHPRARSGCSAAAAVIPDQSWWLFRNSMTSPLGPEMKAIRTSVGGSPPSAAVRGAARETPPAASARA